jgi:hypothetical protein
MEHFLSRSISLYLSVLPGQSPSVQRGAVHCICIAVFNICHCEGDDPARIPNRFSSGLLDDRAANLMVACYAIHWSIPSVFW